MISAVSVRAEYVKDATLVEREGHERTIPARVRVI
jgi:hypothetical protein